MWFGGVNMIDAEVAGALLFDEVWPAEPLFAASLARRPHATAAVSHLEKWERSDPCLAGLVGTHLVTSSANARISSGRASVYD
jgi:hypothetical protein